MKATGRILFDGATAGILAAITMAVWFVIFDAARGQPLNSAHAWAATLFQSFANGMTPREAYLVMIGDVLFFVCVFALIGIASAAILEAAETDGDLFPTMLAFVAAFAVFCIMLLMLLGPSGAVSLPWWKFIAGDLMATTVLMTFFLRRHPALARQLGGNWINVADEGAIAGVIGAVVVALWYVICDAIAGQLFRTPALLGGAIFQGILNPSQVVVTPPLVLGFTALHFFAFIMFGIATAILLRAADIEPVFALAAIVLLACFELFFVGALAIFDSAALQALGFWKILAGNVMAMVAMIVYFGTQHRGWMPRLRERWAMLELKRT